jgi:hypothetical protein
LETPIVVSIEIYLEDIFYHSALFHINVIGTMASFYLTQNIRKHRREKGALFSFANNTIWYDPTINGDVLRLLPYGYDDNMQLPFDPFDDLPGSRSLLLPQPEYRQAWIEPPVRALA